MKNIYLSLIALAALSVASQVQAMEQMQLRSNDETVQLLMRKAEDKCHEAIQRAGKDTAQIQQDLKTLARVQDKIFHYYQAIKTYEAELDAQRTNANFSLNSQTLKNVNRTADEALEAFNNTYGELSE